MAKQAGMVQRKPKYGIPYALKLDTQMILYGKYFDTLDVVVGKDMVGLLTMESGVSLSEVVSTKILY